MIGLVVGVVSLFVDVGFAWPGGTELAIRGVQVAVLAVFIAEQVMLRRAAGSLGQYWRDHSLGAVGVGGSWGAGEVRRDRSGDSGSVAA